MPSSALVVEEIDSNVRPKLSAHGRPRTHTHTHTHAALISLNKLPVAFT